MGLGTAHHPNLARRTKGSFARHREDFDALLIRFRDPELLLVAATQRNVRESDAEQRCRVFYGCRYGIHDEQSSRCPVGSKDIRPIRIGRCDAIVMAANVGANRAERGMSFLKSGSIRSTASGATCRDEHLSSFSQNRDRRNRYLVHPMEDELQRWFGARCDASVATTATEPRSTSASGRDAALGGAEWQERIPTRPARSAFAHMPGEMASGDFILFSPE